MFCKSCVLLEVFLLVIFGISAGETLESLKYRICLPAPQQTCVPISSCHTLNYNFTSLSERDRYLYLESTTCAGNITDPMVCCSSFEYKTDAQICGKNPDYEKIMGGWDAAIDDYPWMVLLEYRNRNVSNSSYNCAGTLINNRYVLTAAHCLLNNELTYVHLGKYDLNNYENCFTEDSCAHPTVRVGIEEKIIHKNYSGMINDIALLRLSTIVYYTDYIQPICLPSTVGLTASNDSILLEIGGWGKGAKSSVKQKLFLPANNFEDCADKYKYYANIELDQTHVCAGGRENQSACVGDSGGPLMAFVNGRHVIEGVITSGYNSCERKTNDKYPMVFARVSSFESWIKENIRP